MQIMITGAAGFIGSHLAERLTSAGHEVTGIDNFDPFYPARFKEHNLEQLAAAKGFTFHKADIRDPKAIAAILREHRIEAVIHLAAKAGVRPSIEHIADYYDVNINGTVNLLECMRAANITKMVFASSSSVYGNNPTTPFSESDFVDNPISPYASTKKSGELLAHVYCHLYQFDITCLRFFTVFGPRQRPDLAIHKFTRLIDQGKSIPFFGDGSTARDYTFIEDIVDGIECALRHLGGYRIYNLGESRTTNLKQLVALIGDALGKEAVLEKLPLQQGDVAITYASIDKAKREIGYQPKYDMKTGIRKFVDWYQANKTALYEG